MIEQQLALPEVELVIGYRDCEAAVFDKFLVLFKNVWEDIPETDRQIIANRLKWAQQTLPLIGLRSGIWLLPSITAHAAYVHSKGGVVIFNAFKLNNALDFSYTEIIRHELAHVWQAGTGMLEGLLSRDHLEAHADWMAKYRLFRPGWRPIGQSAGPS